MPLITVRVDDDLKESMEGVPINWSEAIREAIARIVSEETRRNRVRAGQLNDRIAVEVPAGFDSTKLIREGRDRRYGPRGRR